MDGWGGDDCEEFDATPDFVRGGVVGGVPFEGDGCTDGRVGEAPEIDRDQEDVADGFHQ